MLRGGKCMGYSFGKDGIAEKNKPQKFKKSKPDYRDIDINTGRKKNFADMHQTSNMFGKKTVDKRLNQYKYQGQYDSGNYTHNYKGPQHSEVQYYHRTQFVKNKTFQNNMYPQNTKQISYPKGYQQFQKNLRDYPEKIPKKIYYQEEPQEIDLDFININRYDNKNTMERDYNIITNIEKIKNIEEDENQKINN